MARWAERWGFTWRSFAKIAFVVGIGLSGCNKHEDADEPRNVASGSGANKDQPTVATSGTKGSPTQFGDEDPLHQPFAKAAFGDDDPPPAANRPPDETIVGKPTFTILRNVKALWETIRFTTPDGKAIEYTAIVETALGDIEIALRPDAAPNHVRNFVALAQAGFYDGLPFDHLRFEEGDKTDPALNNRLEQIEAGNPRGTEEINGTVGYWLHLEPSTKLKHEEGTVGACLEGGAESDGCRFYITLTKAEYLDGNFTAFGKVKTGLDVARRIMAQPVVTEDRERDGLRRPEKPVVIKKVTIHTRIDGAAEGAK